MGSRRENLLARDAISEVVRDGHRYIVSEHYDYKSEAYYVILDRELLDDPVYPRTSDVLDAYIVPACLERAAQSGIPICEWGISQSYAPLPALIYGLNYFASSVEYIAVVEPGATRLAIRHVTNSGKYPFCFQKISPDTLVERVTAIFGRCAGGDPAVAAIAEALFSLFHIPLVSMVLARDGERLALSSLGPTRYSRLSQAERTILNAYLHSQEFL